MEEEIDPEITKKRELLFDFWKNIPIICEMKASYHKIAFQEVRSAILDILREGILDTSPLDKTKKRRRHAISAQECQKHVSERLERKVKLSNIYFHLNRLEELGLISEIVTIKGKKHDIAYYGRTAQLFHFGGSDPEYKTEDEERIQQTITKIIKTLNPAVETSKITELFEAVFTHKEVQTKARGTWMAENSDLLDSLEFDILDIDKFLELMQMATPEGYQLAKEFSQLLKFKHG
jgi:DNA-binding transcriptional ArsR family regulator